MKVLLDTHAFLWFIEGSSNLSTAARGLIETSSNQSLLSVASLWEMAIKISLGRLRLGQPFELLIREQLDLNGIETLAIDLSHVAAVVTLPFHHRDPFDRLLIAQAIVEDIPLVSVDSAFDAYPVNRLW
jgi:PIN domain nuclease of toxin-antitoxin system